jgi:ABC-2 type transport system ATP-binding protein
MVWGHEGRLTFRVRGDIGKLLARLQSCVIEDLTITEPSLEEVFLDYYRGDAT